MIVFFSGFIGKVLIEKLLYSCTELDRIYLLLRNKKGVKSEDRLAELYAAPCFQRLKAERPGVFESKVFVVSGNVMEAGLGLSQEDRALLVNRVNVIFHVAASVRFDDTLKYSTQLNLRGTVEVMELAKEMRELCSLVHVSTSYANTNRDPIEEVLYPPLADWRETLAICEKADEHTLKILTPKFLGELPNTYTFTKQLAEHVVNEYKGQLPIIIVRPSIVISSIDEPIPGWIESFNGPVGIFVACGKGTITASEKYHYVKVLLQHLLPAMLIDTLLWLFGKKPMLVKIQRRIYIANLALRYYTTQQWTFTNTNFTKLRSVIKLEDIEQFYYELESTNVVEYFKQCCLGGRRFLLKEKDEDIPKARLHCQRMMVVDRIFQIAFYTVLIWWVCSKIVKVLNLHSNIF
ncbi:hypothetical protein B5X24_HaOG215875 [Helicoverpa armigera]|uniref:Fatty acyl-CoA reductase n=1 Tax=Helicoverpa armigera TaxID=29058 RepID=A0A2W1AZH7_HELAM|nr:hypothetical protein B5X24_HaOG215875 [Helicoverpa armigera]